MIIKATFFGKTKQVKADLYGMDHNQSPEKILWAERPEDYYALDSAEYKGKRVAVVTRDAWIAGRQVEQ